jgi:DNA-binding NarL/FixJ family response regulator
VASAAIALPSPPPAVLVVDPHGTDAELRAAEIAGASAYLRGELDEDRLSDAVSGLLRE